MKIASNIRDLSRKEIENKIFGEKLYWFNHIINARKIHWKEGCEQIAFRPDHVVIDSMIVIS
jgi:hypothetical protein